MPLIDIVPGLAQVHSDPLEETLIRLTKFGKPRVYRTDKNTWYSSIDMHVAVAGTTITVESRYDCKTPSEAASECEQRVKEMLAKLPR